MSSEWSAAAQSLFNECNSVSVTMRHQLIRMTVSIYVYSIGGRGTDIACGRLIYCGHSTMYTTFAVKHRYGNSVVHKLIATGNAMVCQTRTQGINGENFGDPRVDLTFKCGNKIKGKV